MIRKYKNYIITAKREEYNSYYVTDENSFHSEKGIECKGSDVYYTIIDDSTNEVVDEGSYDGKFTVNEVILDIKLGLENRDKGEK